jgi:hypothetical protein
MKKTCLVRFRVVDGKLVPKDGVMKERFKLFLKSVGPDDIVDAIFEADEPDNTKSQLAKIHVMIKEIADETGEEIKTTKENVKDQCGLTYYVDKQKRYKSFADLSRKELSDVIEKLYLLGDFVGINFQKDLS